MCPLGGAEGEERFLHLGKPPSPVGRSAGTEGELQELRGECSNWYWQARQSKTHTDGLCHSSACPSHWCGQGLGAGTWGLESRPGRRLLLAVRRQPEGTRVWSSTTGMLVEEVWSVIEAKHHC